MNINFDESDFDEECHLGNNSDSNDSRINFARFTSPSGSEGNCENSKGGLGKEKGT